MNWRRVLEVFIELILLPMVVTELFEGEPTKVDNKFVARDMGNAAMDEIQDEMKFILEKIYVKTEG